MVPANMPVKLFWSVTVCDTETRCFIDNEHDAPEGTFSLYIRCYWTKKQFSMAAGPRP